MKKLVTLAAIVTLSVPAMADFEKICSDMVNWKKKQPVPEESKYKEAKLAKPITVKEGHKHFGKKDYVFIDARKKGDVQTAGRIPKSVHIESHIKPEKNTMTKEVVEKKLQKYFKRQGRNIASIKDLKDVNIIVFCNGNTCHRSTAASCHLRRMGVSYDKLSIMLDGGFPAWKAAGLPTR